MPRRLTLLERTRFSRGMSRQDLAEGSKVPVRTIRKLEQEEVGSPRLETLVPLAKALELDAGDLLEDFRRHADAAPQIDDAIEEVA